MFVEVALPLPLPRTFTYAVPEGMREAAVPGARVLVKHTTRTVKAMVTALHDRLDVTTLERSPVEQLALNDIGRVALRTASPLAVDPYDQDRTTGAFLLVDDVTGTTLGAGMVV